MSGTPPDICERLDHCLAELAHEAAAEIRRPREMLCFPNSFKITEDIAKRAALDVAAMAGYLHLEGHGDAASMLEKLAEEREKLLAVARACAKMRNRKGDKVQPLTLESLRNSEKPWQMMPVWPGTLAEVDAALATVDAEGLIEEGT